MNHVGEDHDEGQDLRREHDLFDEVAAGDENGRGLHDRSVEPSPGEDSGEKKQCIGLDSFDPAGRLNRGRDPLAIYGAP